MYLKAVHLMFFVSALASCGDKENSDIASSHKDKSYELVNDKWQKDSAEVSMKNQQKETINVKFETNLGEFVIELYKDKAPITVDNFLRYVDEGFYDNTIFHRVIPGFVIQGGGFTKDMNQKETHEEIKNEAENGLYNDRGTLSMARTQVVDSATSQFFVNLNDNAPLNHRDNSIRGFGYAVFGKVIKGMETVDKIASVKTGSRRGHENVPVDPVIVIKASRLN